MNAPTPIGRPSPFQRGQRVYAADGLLDADDSLTSGYVVPVPRQSFADGLVTVWPWPKVARNGQGVPVSVTLDLTAWFVEYAGPTGRRLLPLTCRDQMAAKATGETFAQHITLGDVDAEDPADIVAWCAWWAQKLPTVRPAGPQELTSWPLITPL